MLPARLYRNLPPPATDRTLPPPPPTKPAPPIPARSPGAIRAVPPATTALHRRRSLSSIDNAAARPGARANSRRIPLVDEDLHVDLNSVSKAVWIVSIVAS